MATVWVNSGQERVIDILDPNNGAAKPAGYEIGWGTGAGTAAVGDTTLFTEASEARVAATVTQPAADTLRCVGTLTADGAKTITNAGSFFSAAGPLNVKGDHADTALALGEKIEYTIDLRLKDVGEA